MSATASETPTDKSVKYHSPWNVNAISGRLKAKTIYRMVSAEGEGKQ